MLMPWRVTTAQQRTQVIESLAHAEPLILVNEGSVGGSQAKQPAPRLSATTRSEIVRRLQTEIDPQRDMWIAAGRIEIRHSLYSLLHATLAPDNGASVDLLLALSEHNSKRASGYDGFGEFTLLTLTLERMGVTRLQVPLALDLQRSGLRSAGWVEQGLGVYVHQPAAQPAQTSGSAPAQ